METIVREEALRELESFQRVDDVEWLTLQILEGLFAE